MGKPVEVTVARGHSIHVNGLNGKPDTIKLPGEKVTVDESEIERLVKQKFIVDPHAKKLSAADIEAASVADYVPGGDVQVTEQTDQQIRRGSR
jgi:hypothetical protein